MRINEILTESQLDELSALDIARGVGSAAGKTAHAVGAGLGAVKGAWDAGKAGFQGGKNYVGGQRVGRSNTPTGGSGAGGNLDTLADQDLVAMKARIDGILKSRTQSSAGPAPTPAPSPVGTPPAPATGPAPTPPVPKPAPAPTPAKGIAKGTRAKGPDGQTYTWQGGAWVNDVNNRLANKAVSAALSQGGARDNRIKLPNAAQ